jgi:type VI protein secretion system component VasF
MSDRAPIWQIALRFIVVIPFVVCGAIVVMLAFIGWGSDMASQIKDDLSLS